MPQPRDDDPRVVPTYSAAQIRTAEAPLLAAGVPLMARAAGALAAVIEESLDGGGSRVLVLVGGGDNGGDALFAAAHLATRARVDLLVLSDRAHQRGLAAALSQGARRVELAEAIATDYDVVVDGIVGIGISAGSGLRGEARRAVEALLPRVPAMAARLFAVDVPSGLHPDSGEADDAVLPAACTVVFGALKPGLVVGRGPALAGEIVLVDIGIGAELATVPPVGRATVGRVVGTTGAAQA